MLSLFVTRALPAPVSPSAAMCASVPMVRALKLEMRVFALPLSVSVLGGCTKGNWTICGPQTPRAYCDRAVYDELVNPVSQRDKWTRSQVSPETKSVDWQDCGGLSSGDITPDRLGSTGLERAELSREKLYAAQRCMMSKGYQYIGTCEGDVPSRFPACQARSR